VAWPIASWQARTYVATAIEKGNLLWQNINYNITNNQAQISLFIPKIYAHNNKIQNQKTQTIRINLGSNYKLKSKRTHIEAVINQLKYKSKESKEGGENLTSFQSRLLLTSWNVSLNKTKKINIKKKSLKDAINTSFQEILNDKETQIESWSH